MEGENVQKKGKQEAKQEKNKEDQTGTGRKRRQEFVAEVEEEMQAVVVSSRGRMSTWEQMEGTSSWLCCQMTSVQ